MKKKRAINENLLCSVCRDIGRMVSGVHPRVCSFCVTWPPDPKEPRPKTDRKKGR